MCVVFNLTFPPCMFDDTSFVSTFKVCKFVFPVTVVFNQLPRLQYVRELPGACMLAPATNVLALAHPSCVPESIAPRCPPVV